MVWPEQSGAVPQAKRWLASQPTREKDPRARPAWGKIRVVPPNPALTETQQLLQENKRNVRSRNRVGTSVCFFVYNPVAGRLAGSMMFGITKTRDPKSGHMTQEPRSDNVSRFPRRAANMAGVAAKPLRRAVRVQTLANRLRLRVSASPSLNLHVTQC